ncbi:hypothetical protein JZ751_020945 [Albula glossodonta]|uniref:Uncharacterized protein n=1 Tax=Albula glossodonta TaxID=121402 RepID=A0A8T2PLW0_9TELE|nr:hypothetical protein JZ751_020945 [Albula glossodonta]
MEGKRMILISLLLIAVTQLAVSAGQSGKMTYNGNGTFMLDIPEANITIIDSAQNINCKWGTTPCYVECNNINATMNFTGQMEYPIYNISEMKNVSANFTVFQSDCKITMCLRQPFIVLLMQLKENGLRGPADLKRLLNMKYMCRDLFMQAEIKHKYIEVERVQIKQLMEAPNEGEAIVYDLGDLAMKVVNINLTQTEDYISIEAPPVCSENFSSKPENIKNWIPIEIFQKFPEEKRKLAVVLYESPNQFLFNEEKPKSKLMRVELTEGSDAGQLKNPLQMRFSLFHLPTDLTNYSLQCQFYDWSAGDYGMWSKEGCNTSEIEENDSQKTVMCSCDHMTPFAVLMVPAEAIDPATWRILSVISYIGCGLSAFFTAISILTFVIIRSPAKDHSNTIHVSLSGALFLLNVSFLLNEWLANIEIVHLCLFIALLMHYSLLCSFTWMAIEALHLYMLLVKVFNTYIRHYILKLSVFGWGVPAIIVGVTFTVKNEPNVFYGFVDVSVDNSTSSICWITEPIYFYGLNLSYFAIVFLFNNGILMTVSVRICRLRTSGRKTGMTLRWKETCTVLGLTCLLGTTWGLAFLSQGALSIPMLYLFSIFNSLQGFFIFLWICGTTRKNRREAAYTKDSSLGHVTSAGNAKNTPSNHITADYDQEGQHNKFQ